MRNKTESESEGIARTLSASASSLNASLTSFSSSFATKNSSKLGLSVRFQDDEENDNDNGNNSSSTFSLLSSLKSSPLKFNPESEDKPPSFVHRRSSEISTFDTNEIEDNDEDDDEYEDEDYSYSDHYEELTSAKGIKNERQRQRSAWKSSSNSIAPPRLVERRITMESSELVKAATEVARLFANDASYDDNDDDDDDTIDLVLTSRGRRQAEFMRTRKHPAWKSSPSLTYPRSKGDKPPSFVVRRLSDDDIISFIDTKVNNDEDYNNDNESFIFGEEEEEKQEEIQ